MNISSSFSLGTKPKMRNTTMYLTMEDKKAIIKETSFRALFLLEYYLSVIARDNYVIDDTKTAIATGFTVRQVKDNRRLLKNKNLFNVIRETGSVITFYLYCARKEGVYCNTYFDRLFGYNTVRDVYRNHTRIQIKNILVKNNMNQMETKDIMELLDKHHDKCKSSKGGWLNNSWTN